MSDIVERLRERVSSLGDLLAHEAATAIEARDAEIAELMRQIEAEAVYSDGQRHAIEAQRAEIARLREALMTADGAIAEYIRYLDGGEMRGSYDGKPERYGLRKAGYAARAALKVSP